MRKDYYLVTEHQLNISEIELIEDFWSQRWRSEEGNSSPADSVENREEYQLMLPFLRQLPSGSKVLDGGCGLGEWTIFLGDRGFDVTGMDISQSTINRLQSLFPERQFICGDIRHTGFEDTTFDAYFSWGTF
ncbi:methyltransferase domain-containing protein, partial [bacterium]|nr:methyltransferase domain-containing protein [bacterium]